MSDPRPTCDSMSLEEATISSMREIAAMVEELEGKDRYTKQDRFDMITEFRRKNPHARLPRRRHDLDPVERRPLGNEAGLTSIKVGRGPTYRANSRVVRGSSFTQRINYWRL